MVCLLAAMVLAASTVASAAQQTTDGLAAALAAAESAAERDALLAADPDLVNTALVVALGRIATSAAVAQEYRRAQSLYEFLVEIAHRTGSLREEGEALQNLGNTLYFQRRFPEALASYERRVAVEAQRGDDAAVASAWVGVATIRYSMAEYIEALKGYRLALAIQERLADRPTTASTLISIGNIRYLQGDYAGAIRDYSESRDLYLGIADTDGHARALEGLGRTFWAQGDYVAALSAFGGVLAEGRAREDRSRQGTALQSIADIHLRLGNLDAARSHYEQSRDHFLALKYLGSAGRVWQGLGMTELIAGRFVEAEQAYTTSFEMCGGIHDRECTAPAIVGIAFAQSAQEKFKEAIESYRKAVDRFSALGWREAAARANVGLSQAFLGAGSVADSMEAATSARHAAITIGSDDVLWRALTAEARALRKKGTLDQAIGTARAAAGIVERMHSAALEKPATPIPADASAAFATLAILQAGAGDHVGAWTSASRMRAVMLRSALALNERDISRGMTMEEREQEKKAASELHSLIAQAARERGLPKPDASRLAVLDERVATATAARATWMEALYARYPELRIWRGVAASPAHQDLEAVLTPGTLLLEFLVDDEEVLVLLSERNGDRLETVTYPYSIRRRVLASRVSALLVPAVMRDVVRWRRVAGDLADLIPAAAAARLANASRVIVVPHDVLWRVPFDALPLGDGYLGERSPVIYAGSVDALTRVRQVEAVPGLRALAIAAPALAPDTVSRIQQTAPDWTLRAAESGEREVSAALKTYPEGGKLILKGSAATESALTAHAADVAVLHVAAPFRINGASPLFSPILLAADAAAPSDNGSLEAREVMNLTLRSRVLILSDSAATSMRDGAAAAYVVQWAWLAAGVPSMIMPRWAGDPAASEALLAEFHRRLTSGADAAAALHGARAAIRKHQKWAEPYYWAGWIALGL